MSFRIVTRGASTSLVLADFRCPEHDVFEALVSRESDAAPCPTCGASSPWSPSPIVGRVKLGEVQQGKFEPPPTPGALDTRALADGMPYREWKAQRDKYRRDQKIATVRSKTR